MQHEILAHSGQLLQNNADRWGFDVFDAPKDQAYTLRFVNKFLFLDNLLCEKHKKATEKDSRYKRTYKV